MAINVQLVNKKVSSVSTLCSNHHKHSATTSFKHKKLQSGGKSAIETAAKSETYNVIQKLAQISNYFNPLLKK